MHDVLEHLYERVSKGIVPAVGSLRERLYQEWATHWTPAVVIHDRDATPDDYRSLAWRCIDSYYRRFHPFDQATIIGLEQMITFPLDEAERFKMVGYIDRLAKAADGSWQIHDYKTNSSLPTQAEKDADPQLAYYEIGIRRMWKDVGRVELIWHFLRFDHSIVSSRTTDQLDQLRSDDSFILLIFMLNFGFCHCQTSDFKYKLELQNVTESWHKILLPDDFFEYARHDFSNVRI